MKLNKICTSIEQSQKLVELGIDVNTADIIYNVFDESYIRHGTPIDKYHMPAWSLVALLEMLPNEISTSENFADKYQIDIRKYDGENNTTWYQIAYGNDRGSSGEWHDMINTGEKKNIIDCCFQMILKLHEHKLL